MSYEYLDPIEIAHSITDNINLIPETLIGNKAATLNGTGYIFYYITPLSQEFIDKEAQPSKSLIEIGAGFGNIAIEALKRDVGSYTANDMSKEHLKILINRIKQEFGAETENKFKSIKLLLAKVPQELPSTEPQYDALLIDKVLHFLSPDEIEQFMQWAKKSLKKNGKLYVTTLSPYNRIFRDKVLPIYKERSLKGEQYPGFIPNIQNSINHTHLKNHPNFCIPQSMLFFEKTKLQKLLERHGFKTTQTFSFSLPEEDGPWLHTPEEEGGVVGVIATNS